METYDALKKGFETNDWSDLFGVAIDLSQTALKIAIGWAGVSALAGALITGIQTVLQALGLPSAWCHRQTGDWWYACIAFGRCLLPLAEAVNEGGGRHGELLRRTWGLR